MTKDQYVQFGKRRKQLIRMVKKNPEITVAEVAEKLDLSRTRVYQLCERIGVELRCLAKWDDGEPPEEE